MFTFPHVANQKKLSLPACVALGAGRGGQPRLLIDAPAASGEIYLHGATLTSWRPRNNREVLFTSQQAVFDGVKAIRGGVPICSPWFGSGAHGQYEKKHGWVRTKAWDLRSVVATSDGGVNAVLELLHDDLHFIYEVAIGAQLTLKLSIYNVGEKEREIEAALHHYFAVGDVTAVRLNGLEKVAYIDAVTGNEAIDSGALRLTGVTDRIYAGGQQVVINDPLYKRRLAVRGIHSTHAIVWNPWADTVGQFTDLGNAEWPSFICVESAVIREQAARLQPQERLTMGSNLQVTSL